MAGKVTLLCFGKVNAVKSRAPAKFNETGFKHVFFSLMQI